MLSVQSGSVMDLMNFPFSLSPPLIRFRVNSHREGSLSVADDTAMSADGEHTSVSSQSEISY